MIKADENSKPCKQKTKKRLRLNTLYRLDCNIISDTEISHGDA